MDLTPRRPLTIWAVSDGRSGIENQALGLAEAVARQAPGRIAIKRVTWPAPIRRTPSRALPADLLRRLSRGGETLCPPWPDLWIGNGRASVPFSIAVRRWSGGRTFVVQLQDPLRRPTRFDLVIPPRHDELSGPNVLPITGTPHRITPERLAEAAAAFESRLSPLPRPRLAVLIGGRSRAFDLPPQRARTLAEEIAAAAQAVGGSVLATFSRRTPPKAEAAMRPVLERLPGWVWDGTGENPYFGFLGAADAVLVTEDSANMPAEAAATGRPVYLLRMEGAQARKQRFHADLFARGIARPFEGRIETWTYDPLRETERAAAEVLRRMAAKTALT